MAFVRPIRCVFKRRFVTRSVFVPLNSTAYVIKVQVGEEDVSDLIATKAFYSEGGVKAVVTVKVIM